MLSETLTTPHPNRRGPDDESKSLHEELDLENTAGYLASLKEHSPGQYDDEVSRVTYSISQTVHKSLWFEYTPSAPLPITEEFIGEYQRTSCFGYSICASECLDAAGIEHWIAFANNHAFLLVPLKDRQTTLLINPTNPKLDGEIPNHQAQLAPDAIEATIGDSQRGFAWLSGEAYAKHTKNKDFLELVSLELGGWLTTESDGSIHAQRDNYGRGSFGKTSTKLSQERRLAVAIYMPQAGQEIMQQYGLFQHYVGAGDTVNAFASLQSIGSLFPEIDSRSSQFHFKRFIDQLAIHGDYETAQHSIDILHSSLKDTNDPRAEILRADLIRRLGRHAGDPELLLRADTLYKAVERSSNSSLITQKRRKVANILANLDVSNHAAKLQT